jgi:undecaprenyl-diphosphatase
MEIENYSTTQKLKTFNYEAERQSKLIMIILIISSLLIFLFSAIGIFEGLSNVTTQFLENNLGFTNKWSKWYGPEWFVGVNKDAAAFASYPILFICFTIIIIYYNLRDENRRLWRFIFIIIGGGILLFISKLIFAEQFPNSPIDFLKNSYYNFPSGHAMMGTVFYLTLGVTISRRQHSLRTKKLTILSAILIVIVIGISRILPGFHTVSEVLAGWSLGVIWLCFCWILERKIKKNLKNKAFLSS